MVTRAQGITITSRQSRPPRHNRRKALDLRGPVKGGRQKRKCRIPHLLRVVERTAISSLSHLLGAICRAVVHQRFWRSDRSCSTRTTRFYAQVVRFVHVPESAERRSATPRAGNSGYWLEIFGGSRFGRDYIVLVTFNFIRWRKVTSQIVTVKEKEIDRGTLVAVCFHLSNLPEELAKVKERVKSI